MLVNNIAKLGASHGGQTAPCPRSARPWPPRPWPPCPGPPRPAALCRCRPVGGSRTRALRPQAATKNKARNITSRMFVEYCRSPTQNHPKGPEHMPKPGRKWGTRKRPMVQQSSRLTTSGPVCHAQLLGLQQHWHSLINRKMTHHGATMAMHKATTSQKGTDVTT